MKEKVILNKMNGETEEKKLVAHFKVVDDSKPNIKNVPILILDKQEMNNGNNVLEFMWEKNGVYQAINDENAWSEVKSVVVDIIKNNAHNIEYVSNDNLQADIGPGRSLGLTVAQTDPLTANFKNFVSTAVPNQEETLVETVTPTVQPVINNVESNPAIAPANPQPEVSVVPTNPVVNPVSDIPVVNPVNEISEVAPAINQPTDDVITPFASDAPAIETVINPEPAIETPVVEPASEPPVVGGPEIVEEVKENDFDKMQQEIEAATREYQEKIKSIVDAYKKKITETINEANSLKEQASDHLKNAQAKEQIANMAYQNSVEMSNQAPSLELQKIA